MTEQKGQSCIGLEIKKLIIQEYPELEKVLDKLSDCADPRGIQLKCGKGRGQRQPSEYNRFISSCMKSKHIKGFGQAAPAMKECAAEWKGRK